MTVKDVVAERFRQLCAQRGIKYNELANLSGITPSTVYSLLDVRRRDISITTIKSCATGWISRWASFSQRLNSTPWNRNYNKKTSGFRLSRKPLVSLISFLRRFPPAAELPPPFSVPPAPPAPPSPRSRPTAVLRTTVRRLCTLR